MAEKLTKTVLKEELRRRIEWFESRFNFSEELTDADFNNQPYFSAIAYGRYRAAHSMLWQIENGCFKDGFVC